MMMRQRSMGWLERAKAKLRFNRSQKDLASGRVLTTVEDETQLANLSYRSQGDESLNTFEAWQARGKIRKHPLVVRQLDGFWDAAIATARCVRFEAGRADEGDAALVVEWEDYLLFYKLLFQVGGMRLKPSTRARVKILERVTHAALLQASLLFYKLRCSSTSFLCPSLTHTTHALHPRRPSPTSHTCPSLRICSKMNTTKRRRRRRLGRIGSRTRPMD